MNPDAGSKRLHVVGLLKKQRQRLGSLKMRPLLAQSPEAAARDHLLSKTVAIIKDTRRSYYTVRFYSIFSNNRSSVTHAHAEQSDDFIPHSFLARMFSCYSRAFRCHA